MSIVIATLLAGVFSAGATAAIATFRSRRLAQAQESQRQAEVAAYLDGVPAVPGVTDGALAAALRTSRLEKELSGVVNGQALLEKRMDEANGTGKRTETMVRAIQDHLGLLTP